MNNINKIVKNKAVLIMLSALFLLVSYITMFTAFSKTSYSASAEEVSETSGIVFENKYGERKLDGGDGSAEVAFYADLKAKNIEMAGEGTVLLKNGNDGTSLPTGTGASTKVSVFGKNSQHWKFYTYGAGDASNSVLSANYGTTGRTPTDSSLYEAFESNSNFELNPTLKAFYQNDALSGASPDFDAAVTSSVGIPTGETPYSMYTEAVESSYSEYNDLAVVVLARISREGHDTPMYNVKSSSDWSQSNKLDNARYWDDHYLQIDAYEVEMIQNVMKNFDNVVILTNTSSYMEVGFLNDPTHYLYTDNAFTSSVEEAEAHMDKLSAMAIGLPGTFGAHAIPMLLSGEINPSAKTMDTWVRDILEDPVSQNVAYGKGSSSMQKGNYFLQYDEDIYMGYRYYETRYYEEDGTITTDANLRPVDEAVTFDNRDEWYQDQVVFPFGYGLSYTDFTQELKDLKVINNETKVDAGTKLVKDGTITATIEVTNIGDIAGKDPVQVYYSTPYTDNGIQKAFVELANFDKTDSLSKNSKETVTISFDIEEMKSYDWSDANNNGNKGYELEAGDYYVTVATDAHEAAKQVMQAMEGSESNTVKLTLDSTILYKEDMQTGGEVGNLFDEISGTGYVNDVTGGFQGINRYMVRNDFEGTFPRLQDDKVKDDTILARQSRVSYSLTEEYDKTQPWYYEGTYPNQTKVEKTADETPIKLWHLTGRDYDDPLWENLLDQLTIEQLAEICGDCSYSTVAVPTIDKPATKENDGPMGVKNCISIQWQSSTVSAQSLNRDLIYDQGILVSYSTYFPKEANALGGLYAPVIELHRSPFAGRNQESYSEDPVVSGEMCIPYMRATWEMGVFCTLKHYGLNNTETMRHNVNIWASEQAIRELHCKPYELCIKDGYTVAMMNSCSFIGGWATTGSWALNYGLPRNEWGFRGFIVTDMTLQDTDLTIRAGTDMCLTGSGNADPNTDAARLTTTQHHCIRMAAKNVLYVVANCHGMRYYGGAGLDNIQYTGSTSQHVVSGQETNLDIDSAGAVLAGTEFNGYTYEVADGSTLPTGLALNDDGTITGNTTEVGTHKITIVVGEEQERYDTGTFNQLPHDKVIFPYNDITVDFTFTVYDSSKLPSDVVYSTTTLPDASIGFNYTANVASAIYFDNSYVTTKGITYALAGGNTLPRGLELNSETGVVSGICQETPGGYFFKVVASAPGKESVTASFFITIKQYSISYAPKTLNAVNVGDTVNYSIADAVSAEGLKVTYSLRAGDSLPVGLSLTTTGTIMGTVTKAVTNHTFTVVASAANTTPTYTTYSMSVAGLVVDNQTFAGLVYGKDYRLNILATSSIIDEADKVLVDDNISYTVSLKLGEALPFGFDLYSDGTLAGTAYNVGDVSFTVVIQSPGLSPTEAKITLSINDFEQEVPFEDADSTVDFDNLYNEEVKEGCGGSLLDNGTPFAFIVLLGAGIFTIVVAKNRKKQNN